MKKIIQDKIGCDVKELEQNGIYIPNIDAYAKYKKPIRFSDKFYVEVKLAQFNGTKMHYEYTVRLCENDEIASTGYTTHCFVDDNFKPFNLKRKFPVYFKRLTESMS